MGNGYKRETHKCESQMTKTAWNIVNLSDKQRYTTNTGFLAKIWSSLRKEDFVPKAKIYFETKEKRLGFLWLNQYPQWQVQALPKHWPRVPWESSNAFEKASVLKGGFSRPWDPLALSGPKAPGGVCAKPPCSRCPRDGICNWDSQRNLLKLL